MNKAFFAAGALLLPLCARSQQPVNWSAELGVPTSSVRAGRVVPLRVKAKIDRGWYVYSITQPPGGPVRARLWLPTGQPFELRGAVSGPRPEVTFDRNFGIKVEKYRRTAEFVVPVQVISTARRGRYTLQLHIRYQACNDKLCLPPRTVRLSPLIVVSPG